MRRCALFIVSTFTFACFGIRPVNASPIPAIGGSFTVNSGSSNLVTSTLTFNNGLVTSDGGAGTSLPFQVSPLHVTSVGIFSADLSTLTASTGSVSTSPQSLTLTGVSGPDAGDNVTFSWTNPAVFQYHSSDNSASLTIDGISLGTNTFPPSVADFSLFTGSTGQLTITLQAAAFTASPGTITLSPGATASFTLLPQPFDVSVPEPTTLAVWGMLATTCFWCSHRNRTRRRSA